jgi:hypothetical protein
MAVIHIHHKYELAYRWINQKEKKNTHTQRNQTQQLEKEKSFVPSDSIAFENGHKNPLNR